MPRTQVPEEGQRVVNINELKNTKPRSEAVIRTEGESITNDGLSNLYWWDPNGNPSNADGKTIIESNVSGYQNGEANEGVWRRMFKPSSEIESQIENSAGNQGAVQYSDGSGGFLGNANYLYVDNSNGNVGINTTSPSSTLQVKGEDNSGSTVNTSIENSNGLALFSLANNGSLTLEHSSSNGAFDLLTLNSSSADGSAIKFGLSGGGTSDFSIATKPFDEGTLAIRDDTENNFPFATLGNNKAGNYGFQSSFARIYNTMHVFSSGNVGIGTDSPSSALDVNGNINARQNITVSGALNVQDFTFDQDSGDLVLSDSNGVELIRQPKGGSTQFVQGAEIGSIEAPGDSFTQVVNAPSTSAASSGDPVGYTFSIDNQSVLEVRADADGSGGITNKRVNFSSGVEFGGAGDGLVSNSGTLDVRLDINDGGSNVTTAYALNFGNQLNVVDDGSNQVTVEVQDGNNSGLDADTLDGIEGNNYARTDIAETFNNNVYFTGGNVGIGTSGPDFDLEVISDIAIGSGNNSGTSHLYFDHKSNESTETKAAIISEAAGNWGQTTGIRFAINNVSDNTIVSASDTKMIVGPSGDVGIGTTSPSYKLDVNGDINAQSVLRSGGNVVSPDNVSDAHHTRPSAGEGIVDNSNTFDVRLDIDSGGSNVTTAYALNFGSDINVVDDGSNQVTVSVDSNSFTSAAGNAGAVQYSDGSGGFLGNANYLYVDNSDGSVGVGTSSPAEDFSVDGNLGVKSGYLWVKNGNNAYVTGGMHVGGSSVPANALEISGNFTSSGWGGVNDKFSVNAPAPFGPNAVGTEELQVDGSVGADDYNFYHPESSWNIRPSGGQGDLLIHQNFGSNFSLIEARTRDVDVTDTSTDSEATLALTRSDSAETAVEFLDLYNNGYYSSGSVRHGLRVQKRGGGKLRNFEFEWDDGNNQYLGYSIKPPTDLTNGDGAKIHFNVPIGILTASPSYALDVNGDINAQGELRSSGNIVSPDSVSNAHHTRPSAGEGLSDNSNTFDVRLDIDEGGSNVTTAYGLNFGSNIDVVDDGSNKVTIDVDTASLAAAAGSAGAVQYASSSGGFLGNTSYLYVDDSNGNIGIGTNSPTRPLEVVYSGSDSEILVADGRNSSIDGKPAFRLRTPATGNQKAFQLNSGNESFAWASFSRNDSSSPTANPGFFLGPGGSTGRDVGIARTGSNQLSLFGDTGIDTENPQNKLDISGAAVIGSSYAGSNTAPSNGLLVEGNIGIGKTAPSYALDVSGTINASQYNVNGSQISTDDLIEGSNEFFTDEKAQDAVGTIMTGSGSTTVTYDDAANTITINSTGSNVSAGDGIVSNSGTFDVRLDIDDNGSNVTTAYALNFGSQLNAIDDGSNQVTISHSNVSSASSSNTLPTVIRSVATDSNGHVTGLSTGTFNGGTDVNISGNTIDHANTGAADSSNSGSTVLQSLTTDGRGHVETIGTATFSAGDGLSLAGTTFNARLDVDDGGTDVTTAYAFNFGTDINVIDDGSNKVTVEHANTGSDQSTGNSGQTFLQNISTDGRGHVDSVSTGTLNVDNYQNWTITGDGTTTTNVNSGNTVTFASGGNLSTSLSTRTLTISHNTSGGAQSTGNSGSTFIQNINTDGDGHVTSVGTTTATYDNYSSWTIEEGDGEQTSIGSGQKLEIYGGSDINTEITSTGNETRLRVAHDNTGGAQDTGNSGGTVIQNINTDGNGHVTTVGDVTFSAGEGLSRSGYTFNARIDVDDGGSNVTTAYNFNFGSQLNVIDDGSNQVTIEHANTSSQGNVSTGGSTIIDDIGLDSSGHVNNINTENRSLDDWNAPNNDIDIGGNDINNIGNFNIEYNSNSESLDFVYTG